MDAMFQRFCVIGLVGLVVTTAVQSDPIPTFPGLPSAQPDRQTSLLTTTPDWYKDSVFYHVWLKAFADSNQDGIGDLRGLTQKLDYLTKDLGVTALWLSPHLATASTLPNLHGYDVIDHYQVDPRFGTKDDLRALLVEAHRRGVRVVFDFVPDFVSSKHPWFQDALAGRNGKRDWFLFREKRPDGWTGNDKKSDWYRAKDGSWYYSAFWDQMPALNFRHPEVRAELGKVARYWLDFGFDGVRVDAIRYLYINEAGRGVYADQIDQPETIAFCQALRQDVLDPYTSLGYSKFMVAENWTGDQAALRSYFGSAENPAFQMTLDFNAPGYIARKVEDPTTTDLDDWWQGFTSQLPVGRMGTFLSNHDNVISRPATRLHGNLGLQRAAAALLLTGPGTPFLYYGNEIGQPGAAGDDINLRAPFDWAQEEAQRPDPNSLFTAYRDLVSLHKAFPAFSRGDFQLIPTDNTSLLAFTRTSGDQTVLVIHNLSDTAESPAAVLPKFKINRQVYGAAGPIPPHSLAVWLVQTSPTQGVKP